MRRLAQGMARLDSVTAGIAPSPYAGVGPNVIAFNEQEFAGNLWLLDSRKR